MFRRLASALIPMPIVLRIRSRSTSMPIGQDSPVFYLRRGEQQDVLMSGALPFFTHHRAVAQFVAQVLSDRDPSLPPWQVA